MSRMPHHRSADSQRCNLDRHTECARLEKASNQDRRETLQFNTPTIGDANEPSNHSWLVQSPPMMKMHFHGNDYPAPIGAIDRVNSCMDVQWYAQ